MSGKLPPIKYKPHPQMVEIMEEKRRRRQILQNEKQKLHQDQMQTRKQKKEYFQANKQVIKLKEQAIYIKKLEQRNRIREQQKQRQKRIQMKKAERLAQLLPERRQLIQEMKQQYLKYLTEKDVLKQMKIKQIMQKRLQEANKEYENIVPMEVRVKQEHIIDINEGVCILCLTSEAQIYMTQCKHLISCSECEFILRMQKKCPVCRKMGNYKNLKDPVKKRKSSVRK